MSTICLTLIFIIANFPLFFRLYTRTGYHRGGNYLQLWCTCGLGRDPALLIFSPARQGLVIFHSCLSLLIFSFFYQTLLCSNEFYATSSIFFFCSTFQFALVFFFFLSVYSQFMCAFCLLRLLPFPLKALQKQC